MARFLAVDWDHSEVRFLLGTVAGDQVTVLKTGAMSIREAETVSEENAEGVEGTAVPEMKGKEKSDADLAENEDSTIPAETSAEGETARGSENGASPPANFDSDGEDASAAPTVETKKRSSNGAADQKSDALGRALKRLLRQNGVLGGNLILCLPRDCVELLYLNLPNVSEAELPDIVKNQVLRDSSAYIEGHPLDFLPLGSGEKSDGQKILSASITRVELRHLRAVCSASGRKPSKIELRLTALCEFVRAGKIAVDKPTLAVQEGRDEIDFVVFDRNRPVYLRAFQIRPDLPEEEREERLKTEILRTLRIGSDGEPIASVILFGAQDDCARLTENLTEEAIHVERIDPFDLPGVKTQRGAYPERVGLFAPLVGTLLAERGKNRPLVDLLHPRQKPKPPNYALYFILFLLALSMAAGLLWRWNRNDIASKQVEIERLQKQLASLQSEYQSLLPQFTILDNAAGWDQFGVNVLDELREILQRIPSSPDLLVSRLAYNGLDPQFGLPVFIINAKVTHPSIYQQFYQKLTSDGSHGVNSRGVQPTPAAAGTDKRNDFEYSFTAVILCRRRTPNDFLKNLPPEIREISNDKPEFYDLQMNPSQKRNGRVSGQNPNENNPPPMNNAPGNRGDNPSPMNNAPGNQGDNPS